MNAVPVPNNPYPALRGDVAFAPFVGRQKAFEYLYQQLTGQKGCVILGRQESGKTSVLRHFGDYFDESFVGVYLALKNVPLQNEGDWLLALAEATLQMMVQRNMSMSRVVTLQPDAAHMREWFMDTFIQEVTKITRIPRLIFLLDDAGILLNAMEDGKLPPDQFAFMQSMVTQRPELGIVLAMDSRYEPKIPLMSPLITLTDVFRLENLTEAETALLLRQPVEGEYTVDDEAVNGVFRATGGQPRLIQRFGFRLYQYWESHSNNRKLSAEDVKAVIPQVYTQSATDFQRIWNGLNRSERLTLMAITRLQYADPLAAVTAGTIEHWLIESDFPLDQTAIHVALRSLEYEDVITQAAHRIQITVGLMQTWVLDNGRVGEDSASRMGSRFRLWWAAVITLIVVVILLALITGQKGASSSVVDAPPTVTLVTTP